MPHEGVSVSSSFHACVSMHIPPLFLHVASHSLFRECEREDSSAFLREVDVPNITQDILALSLQMCDSRLE